MPSLLYHIGAGRIAMSEAATLCITTVWASWRPNQSDQNALHFLNTHIHMLDHTAVAHAGWHMPTTAFLLQLLETSQDDSFTVRQTISHIGEVVTRVTVRHVRLLSIDDIGSVGQRSG